MKQVSQRLKAWGLVGIVALALLLVLGDPLESRIRGMRDSRAVFNEMFPRDAGSGDGVKVVDLIGPQRYVRASLKLYDHYRPGLLPELYGRGYSWWMSRCYGRWPDLDRRVMDIRLPPNPALSKVRWMVAHSLQCAGPAAAPAVDRLVRLMESKGSDNGTLDTLAAIGPAASNALPMLRTVASSTSDPWLLTRVATTFRNIEPGSQDFIVPLAIRGLTSTNERIRAKSADLLGIIGPAAVSSIPRLQELRSDPWIMVRTAVDQALKSIGNPEGAASRPQE